MFIVEQEKVSIRLSRRRYSLFTQNRNEKIQRIQNKYFPKWMRITAFTLSFVYSLLLFVTIIIHLSTFVQADRKCEKSLGVDYKKIWENGCKVKTPFCKKMFQAECDCAVLEVKNHNMTKLPPKIIEMKSLQRLTIKNGPLEELPTNVNELEDISILDFSFNQLTEFDVDVSKWQYLNSIHLSFNNIKSLHESVWSHPELTNLAINDNIGLTFPEKIDLKQLLYFAAENNTVKIPKSLGRAQFPAILFLYLNGNIMPDNTFPEKFETLTTIRFLGIARCSLTELPSKVLVQLKQLHHLDARNNNITSIDPTLIDFFKTQKVNQIYLDGNEGLDCKAAGGTDCDEKVCSKYCYSKFHKNGECDKTCNSKDCNYDEGDCT